MSEAMLNIIHAVLAYKAFTYCQNCVVPKEKFDWYDETKKYYYSLPLPVKMKKNQDHFNTILRYENTEELRRLDQTNYKELGNYDSWFWIFEQNM